MAAIAVGAVIPVLYLILEQLPETSSFARGRIGPYVSGISTYLLAGTAMVVGSLLKPGRATTSVGGAK